MAAQLSKEAAHPLARILVTAPCRSSSTGPSTKLRHTDRQNRTISLPPKRHDDFMTGKCFPHYWPHCDENPPATDGFPSQWSCNSELWFFSLLFWGTMTLHWHLCNSSCIAQNCRLLVSDVPLTTMMMVIDWLIVTDCPPRVSWKLAPCRAVRMVSAPVLGALSGALTLYITTISAPTFPPLSLQESINAMRCGNNFTSLIFKLFIQNNTLDTRCEIALRWTPTHPNALPHPSDVETVFMLWRHYC